MRHTPLLMLHGRHPEHPDQPIHLAMPCQWEPSSETFGVLLQYASAGLARLVFAVTAREATEEERAQHWFDQIRWVADWTGWEWEGEILAPRAW
jgi:hypothetical protein